MGFQSMDAPITTQHFPGAIFHGRLPIHAGGRARDEGSASMFSCGMMTRCGAAKSALRDAYEWRRCSSAGKLTKERSMRR